MTAPNSDVERTNPSTQNLSIKIAIDESRIGVLDSQDIVECWFIEDIFSFNMYGKLVFYDNVGLIENGPLTGTEIIELVYGVEEVREVAFLIWKLNRIVQVADVNPTDVALIEIYFVDSSFYRMTVPKYSRSFPAKTVYTDVVKHTLEKMIGWTPDGLNIEESKNSLEDNWVIPYWNISNTIKWILKRSIGKDSGTSGYLCYNNTYKTNSVNVRTLNWLFGERNFVDDRDYYFQSSEPGDQNKIWEWWINGVDHDTIGIVRGGVFRGFDPSTKTLIEQPYAFTDGLKTTVLNGKKSIFSDLTDYSSSQITFGEATLENLQSVIYHEWVKKYSLQNLLTVMMQGNEKRYAGHQVQIKWQSIDQVEQLWQKQLEGKYLIKSITHNFVGSGSSGSINYVNRITLIKNAYQDSDAKSLLNATKTNLSSGRKQRIILSI